MSSTSTDGHPSPRALVLLGLLALLPYLNALPDGFTFDDGPVIRKNPVVTDGVDVLRILASPTPPGDLYRPITMLSFAINERLSPGRPALFHAVNISLHAITTLLVYLLALRLLDSARAAVIGAALFAVHPIHTEAVTNIVGRAELLAALFGLAALLTAARAGATARRGSRLALQVTSLTAFSLAVMSKESGLTVLPLILWLRVVRRGPPVRTAVWQEVRSLDWVAYLLCALVFVGLRFYVTRAMTPTETVTPLDNVLAFVPPIVRIRSALGVLWDYFGLLNVPFVLSADYSYLEAPVITSWVDARFFAGLALLVTAALVFLRRREPAIRFGVVFPLVAISLTANVLFPIGTIKAERLLYFPSVGWVIVLAYGFDLLLATPRYRSIAVAALAAVVLAFGVRTWLRNMDWADNATLYRSMVQGAPNSAKARYNLGVALQDEGAHDAAIVQFRRALSIYPWAEGAALGVGYSLAKKGFSNEAIEWYERALEIAPGLTQAHIDLCGADLTIGRMEAAAAACRDGLRYDPTDATLLKELGLSLVGMGDTGKGIAVLRRSLALNRGDQWLQSYLARQNTAAVAGGGEQVAIQ
jgi:Flp pilus assembly protein TadD